MKGERESSVCKREGGREAVGGRERQWEGERERERESERDPERGGEG